MKIPYDQIIAKANKRKELLQELEQLLPALKEQIEVTLGSSNALGPIARRTKSVLDLLDAEGRGLLPEDAVRPVEFYCNKVLALYGTDRLQDSYHTLTPRQALDKLLEN